jgi:hypothetical protein
MGNSTEKFRTAFDVVNDKEVIISSPFTVYMIM